MNAHTLHPEDDTTTQIVDLMMRAVRRIRVCAAAELAPVGLTHAQSRAVRVVADAAGPMRMADLAAALEIVPRAATSSVDALEEAGIVARRTDPTDRRSVLVSLTPKGRRLRARLAEARGRAADDVLGPLSGPQRRQLLLLMSELCGECCGGRPVAGDR